MKPKGKALVIDNGEGICGELTRLLLNDNYNITMANDSKEAIENLEDCEEEIRPSVVLLSIDLPDEADGDFMRHAGRIGLSCPVIAMSHNSVRLKRLKEYVPGIKGHLKKPVSERSFKRVLEKATQTLQ